MLEMVLLSPVSSFSQVSESLVTFIDFELSILVIDMFHIKFVSPQTQTTNKTASINHFSCLQTLKIICTNMAELFWSNWDRKEVTKFNFRPKSSHACRRKHCQKQATTCRDLRVCHCWRYQFNHSTSLVIVVSRNTCLTVRDLRSNEWHFLSCVGMHDCLKTHVSSASCSQHASLNMHADPLLSCHSWKLTSNHSPSNVCSDWPLTLVTEWLNPNVKSLSSCWCDNTLHMHGCLCFLWAFLLWQ